MKKLSEDLREQAVIAQRAQDTAHNANASAVQLGKELAYTDAEARAKAHEAASGWRPIADAPLDAWMTAGKYTTAGEWITIAIIRPSDTPTPRMGLTHFLLHPPPPEREP